MVFVDALALFPVVTDDPRRESRCRLTVVRYDSGLTRESSC